MRVEGVDMNRKKLKSNKFRRGSILGLMIVIGLCLAILGWGMLQMGFGARVNSAISVSSITAREAADAGIAKALFEMNSSFPAPPATGTDITGTLSNSEASYSYRVDPCGTDYLITSRGFSSRGQRVVYGLTDMTSKYEFGLLVTDTIMLRQGTLVDGYDSTKGFYGDENSKAYVRVGTTSIQPKEITLKNEVDIEGDLLVGVGGDPDVVINETPVGGAHVRARYAMPYQYVWDIKTPPVDLPPGEQIVYLPDPNYPYFPKGVFTISQSGVYSNITLDQGQLLCIESNTVPKEAVTLHITGDLNLGQGAELRIEGDPFLTDTWTPVTIYLAGNINGSQSNGINNMTKKPLNFFLYGTGEDQTWNLKNGTAFFGVYYGRNADISISAKGGVYGSVTGRSFELDVAAGEAPDIDFGLHYDQSLGDPMVAPTGYAIKRWWEEIGPYE
jgi:hypothetical protein